VTIELNGSACDLPDGAMLEDAIAVSGVHESRRGVAVAVDGEVVPRAEWEQTALADGAKVEVLQAVQGG
jgi:sulfur carrier protein